MKEKFEGWLAETWGERVNGDDHRFVTPSNVAMELAWDEEEDPRGLLALPDKAFLAVVRAAVDRVSLNDNEMNLSAATVMEIADEVGGSVWVVDLRGGGYIASEPPQEFRGP